MTTEPITVEYLVALAQRLSAPERMRLRVALSDLEEAEARATQRTKNQAAIAALDAMFFTDTEGDDEQDDSWWPDFARAINTESTSNRPLYPEVETLPNATDRS